MRMMATHRVTPGLTLARDVDVGHPQGIPLLRKGVEITERYRDKLLAAGVHAVWVYDALSAGIEPAEALSERTQREAGKATRAAFEGAREAFGRGQGLAPDVVDHLAKVAGMIAEDISSSPEMAMALTDLAGSDAYTHRHSIDTATVGLLVARRVFETRGWIDTGDKRRFDKRDQRLTLLGLGLLLHDVGKMAIPHEILHKPGRLDDTEMALMRKHPEHGLALLSSSTVSMLVKVVVGSHHERWNGSGYPHALRGRKIHQFARIAAVADVYDAVTSERPYHPAETPDVGVGVIREGRGTQFDPEVVEAFRTVVFPYPPGIEVVLADGRRAVVAAVDPECPDRPTVRIENPDGPLEIVADGPVKPAPLAEPPVAAAAA